MTRVSGAGLNHRADRLTSRVGMPVSTWAIGGLLTVDLPMARQAAVATAWRGVGNGNHPGTERVDTFLGCDLLGQRAMRQRLPGDVYERLTRTVHEGEPPDSQVADAVAAALKDWAIEHGATHYPHWFQPLSQVHRGAHRVLTGCPPSRQGGSGTRVGGAVAAAATIRRSATTKSIARG